MGEVAIGNGYSTTEPIFRQAQKNSLECVGMSVARLVIFLMVLGLLDGLCLPVCAAGDDDTLPNFNAPQDNSPLNVDKVNRIFGIAMFQSASLWNEDDTFVGKRLGWPEESRTSTLSSFRLYPTEQKPATILGARAYSCAFYATKGKPTEVSIVFANKGDYEWDRKFLEEYAKKKGADVSQPQLGNESNHEQPARRSENPMRPGRLQAPSTTSS